MNNKELIYNHFNNRKNYKHIFCFQDKELKLSHWFNDISEYSLFLNKKLSNLCNYSFFRKNNQISIFYKSIPTTISFINDFSRSFKYNIVIEKNVDIRDYINFEPYKDLEIPVSLNQESVNKLFDKFNTLNVFS